MIRQFRRFATTLAEAKPQSSNYGEVMSAWQVEKFGGMEQLTFTKAAKIPELNKASIVKLKVLASSVNPLDVYMLSGYGNVVLDCLKQVDAICENKENVSTPIILGRDFCGEIIAKGVNVRGDLKIGDIVYGVVPPHNQGSHADLLVVDDYLLAQKPEGLTPIEAASIPYTAMTAWSALKITGDLAFADPRSKRVLVIGGSGGVGTAAIQLLKSWGSTVVATCRTDAIPLVSSLKPDIVIDYTKKESMNEIELAGKYDIILDASGNITLSTYIPFLKEWANSKIITLRSPFLKNTDSLGLVGGMVKNVATLLENNVLGGALTKGSTVRWGFFAPLGSAINEINKLVKKGEMKPVIDSSFHFDDMPKAFQRVNEGHLRGKVVVSHSIPAINVSPNTKA